MTAQVSGSEKVIHFTCQHCQVSLTVDASLAGVTGPCPSCGAEVTAPAAPEPGAVVVKPRELKKRSVPAEQKEEVSVQEGPKTPSSSSRRRRGGGRSVSPNTGLSESYQEKVEIAAVVKMLVAGLVVLGVVLVIAYWLKSEMA